MTRARLNFLLLFAAVMLAAWPLLYAPGAGFTGSDNRATDAIRELDPGYQPWAEPLLAPGETGEKLLFAAQATGGLAFIAFYFGSRRLRSRRAEGAPTDAA